MLAGVMFGTDVVSCLFAERINLQLRDQLEFRGYIGPNGDDSLERFSPGTKVIREWRELAELCQDKPCRIFSPGHRLSDLERWLSQQAVSQMDWEVVELPEPSDYMIKWLKFEGTIQEAFEACKGYDSSLPTTHAIETRLKLQSCQVPRTPCDYQLRQLRVVQGIFKHLRRPLRVIDFGGAVGEQYHDFREELDGLIESWTVVETPNFCAKAKTAFEGDILKFNDSLDNFSERPDLVVASSSLQYVDDVDLYLKQIIGLNPRFICIDRTAMNLGEESRIYIQRVFRNQDRWRYETSYPMQCHPEKKYLEALNPNYELISKEVLANESGADCEGIDVYSFWLAAARC